MLFANNLQQIVCTRNSIYVRNVRTMSNQALYFHFWWLIISDCTILMQTKYFICALGTLNGPTNSSRLCNFTKLTQSTMCGVATERAADAQKENQ